MPDRTAFDLCYRETRDRLLSHALVLSGDPAAGRSIVVEALAREWARWDDSEEPAAREASVRREVTAGTQRQPHSRSPRSPRAARPAGSAAATLEALALLSGAQRRVVALTGGARVPLPTAAGDLGVSELEARQDQERAVARLRESLGTPTASLTDLLSPLSDLAHDVDWPPARRIRRAGRRHGRAGRRPGRAVLAMIALLALIAGVLAVIDVGPVRSAFAGALDRVAGHGEQPGLATVPSVEPSARAPEEEILPESSLLSARPFARAVPRVRWTQRATGDNSSGNGLVLSCQEERYADPFGEAALVRRYRGASGSATAVQLTEASTTERAARRAFERVVGWVGGCTEPRTQLIASRTLAGAGDQGRQLLLRSWSAPRTTTMVEVARTGIFTTTTATTTTGTSPPDPRAHARLQVAAVSALCDLDGAGACPDRRGARLRPSAPPRTGEEPALLSEVDLPPVGNVERPWVGTPPAPARTNAAASRCDAATFTGRFRGARWQHTRTRTFLVPQARLPATFGLTETVGTLPRARAAAFVDRVRSQLASCSRREAGTRVRRLAGYDAGPVSLTAWELTTEVADRRSMRMQMAVIRRGTAVAQIGFVPTRGAVMDRKAFVDLARRGLARLEAMPKPRPARAQARARAR